jgi:hypothetical protein
MSAMITAVVETPAKRSAFQKVRAIMKNGGENSIAELRALAQRRAEICKKYEAVITECKTIEAEVVAAERDFVANPSVAGVRRLVSLRPQLDIAIDLRSALTRSITYGQRVESEFLSECQRRGKDYLRNVLIKAASFHLAQAREKFDAELKRARQTLAQEGFDDEEVRQAPRVRDAQRQLERFERLVANIQSSTDEHLWQNALALLEK